MSSLNLKVVFQSILEAYEDWLWKYGPDRKELAHERLRLNAEAVAKGEPGPYLEPEKYNFY